MKKINIFYIIIIIAILLIPFALMPIAGSDWTTETTALAESPKIRTEEGGVNVEFLSDAGDYFEDHFAFRPWLVTGNSLLQKSVFQTSSTDQVIVGTENWLYYSGTLGDYRRTNVMSDRAVYNAAHNLKLVKDYYDLLGIDLIVTIAPNKNSLYPEHQPYTILAGEGRSNKDAFAEALQEQDVCYADLFAPLSANEECLYYKQDTHWTAKGAALAFDVIMNHTKKDTWEDYLTLPYKMEAVHDGDLAEMLYPQAVTPEEDAVWEKTWNWDYVEPVEDAMTEFIKTESPGKDGSLYMYRDSFGSALIPYFAEEYGTAEFSRLTPYKISDPVLYKTDTVVIEKAERNIRSFAEEAPIMQNPVRFVEDSETVSTRTTCNFGQNGGFYVIKGAVDPEFFFDNSQIYVMITNEVSGESTVYEAFYLSADREDGSSWDSLYQINLLKKDTDTGAFTVRVLVETDGNTICVAEKEFEYS